MRSMLVALILACAIVISCGLATAEDAVDLSKSQMPAVVTVPPEAQPSDHFDPEAATNAYLAEIPPAARARSDAYFEGGYWLLLWDFLVAVIIYLFLLYSGLSAKMRDLAERVTRFPFIHTFLYWVQFTLVTSILGFPMVVYEQYFREWKYGLATQTFGPWMGDQTKELLITLILGGIITTVLVGIVRKLPRTWHIWGAIVALIFLAFTAMIAPVYLLPMFNKVTRLEDPKITGPILSLARANEIPAHDVFQVDASRQTTRMSANVSGFGSTMRITLNDNLLRRGSPEEIQAVMGHEMGHYVLNHVYKGMMFFLILIVTFFVLLRGGLDWAAARYAGRWRLRGSTDVAALPVVFLLATCFFFVLTPVLNTFSRTTEAEADNYGLNASRQPDGFAQAAIHLGEYRKMSPGALEEWFFYDHPSGRTRIHGAMQWKAENLQLFRGANGAPAQPAQ